MRRAWRFRPVSSPVDRHDDRSNGRPGVLAAVRAAGASHTAFRLRLSRSGVTLETEESGSARWVERVLLLAYEPHQWEPVLPSGDGPASPRWVARPVGTPDFGLPSPAEMGGTFDALGRAMAILPPGAEFRVEADGDGRAVTRRLPLPTPSIVPSQVRRTRVGPAPPELFRPDPVGRSTGWRLRLALRGPERLASLYARSLEAAWRAPGAGEIRFHRARAWSRGSWIVTSEELVRFLPSRECPGPSVARYVDRPRDLRLPLGWEEGNGNVVGLAADVSEGRHVAVLGETGMGKSSLLLAVASRASRSAGVVLLDPLGETARGLRAELTRAGRPFRWISPVDAPLGLNALDGRDRGVPRSGALAERRSQDVVHALRRVRSGRYADSSYWGPRLEEMLGRAVRVAAALPEGTLEDAHTLLATGGRTTRDVPSEAAGALHALAERIRERPEDADGARRLLYEVVGSPLLRRLLCDRAAEVGVAELVAPGCVTVVAGDASTVGETNARYLLAVYLALIWSELLARPRPAKTFVVLDEVQWFGHESLAEMLRLARRGNIHVVLGTQALSSLPDPIREAVWTNVADFVVFRGSPDDARELSRLTAGVRPEQLTRLPRGHALFLSGKGHRACWIRTARLPKPRARDPPPEPAAPVPPREGPPSVATVLRALRVAAAPLAPDATLRVEIAELRRTTDPGGSAVRSAGALLGRVGALVRTGAGANGTYWELRVDRLPADEGAVEVDAAGERAVPPQPSLSRNGSFP